MTFAANASNDYLTGRAPVRTPAGIEDVSVRYALTLATSEEATNQIGEIGILPAGCVPIAAALDADDLDTNGTPTAAIDIGLSNAAVANNLQAKGGTAISTAAADGGAAWAAGLTTAQAGGQTMITSKALSRVTPVAWDRYILLKFATGSATAAAGTVGLTLSYRPA
jgi:hypothetical protein